MVICRLEAGCITVYYYVLSRIMSSSKTISFRLDGEKVSALDRLAEALDRDRSYLLNEAVAAYLDAQHWQIEQIEAAIRQADADNFVDHEEVRKTILKRRRHR